MTTIDMNRPEIEAAGEPGTIGAGSAIYRRLDRRARRPKLMMAIPIAVLAIAAAGGVIAYESMSKTAATPPPAPAPVAAQPAPVTPPAPTPVQPVVAPTLAPAPQPRLVAKADHPHVTLAAAARPKAAPKAASAVSTGENANAYMPPMTAPPAQTTAQPSFSVPLPTTAAAPAAQSAAPVNPPQPAPAPQQSGRAAKTTRC